MNDEKLIWEAYAKKQQKDPYRQEVDRIMEMYPDDYDNWLKEFNDKLNQTDAESPEFQYLYGLQNALDHEYRPSKKRWEQITDEVNSTARDSYNNKFHSDLMQITDNAHINAIEYSGAPSYYRRCIGSLESGLVDSEHATPEVKEWFKTNFGLVG
jgi:type I site-specific restriction-modification system R (restriction) subunit